MFALISLSALLKDIVINQVLPYLSVSVSGPQLQFCQARIVHCYVCSEEFQKFNFLGLSAAVSSLLESTHQKPRLVYLGQTLTWGTSV